MGDKLFISAYHYTRELKKSRYPNIKGLDTALFKKQIEFMVRNFSIVTMEEVINAWNGNGGVLPKNALLLTFDDGYIDHYTVVLPILKEFGVQGSFFLPGRILCEHKLLDVNKVHYILATAKSEHDLVRDVEKELDRARSDGWAIPLTDEIKERYVFPNGFDSLDIIFVKRTLQTAIDEGIRSVIVDNLYKKYVDVDESVLSRELYMNYDQVRLLKNEGMFIGLHGYDHYWLGNIEKNKMRSDIDLMLEVMDEFIDKDNWVMNYPYGNYNENVVNYISRKGCVLGVTTKPQIANTLVDDRFELPRLDCNAFPPKSEEYRRYYD